MFASMEVTPPLDHPTPDRRRARRGDGGAAAVSGARTLLYDPVAEALEGAAWGGRAALDRQVEKGGMGRSEADAARRAHRALADLRAARAGRGS